MTTRHSLASLAIIGVVAAAVAAAAAEQAAIDITDRILTRRSADCADYADAFRSEVRDIQRGKDFGGAVLISVEPDACVLRSNNIPNHDFNDASAHFADPVQEIAQTFRIPRSPALAGRDTPLGQRTYDAVMLNGVPVDLLSAGCYRPGAPGADRDGNVPIGCSADSPWLLDPLGAAHRFGADEHNAHTQPPNGMYHYHGNPMALFDDDPGPDGSPVIGFAADGFPIYGSWFRDAAGTVRKARSGYALRQGQRPKSATDPGGPYDGTYIDDWAFTGAGDLDACNGMTIDGQYGYYVTDSYPWILGCLKGTPHASFEKRR